MRLNDLLLVIFIALFLFSGFMIISPLFGDGVKITGFAASGSAVSNVTVSKSFSISLSSNLSAGINFGDVSTTDNINATDNYFSSLSNFTMHVINVSTNSTVNVDFCLSANADLTDPSSGDKIVLANETYANATTTSSTVPDIARETTFTTSGIKAGQGITGGNGVYYRFWLDVTSTVPSGTYNNTVTFTGKEEGDSC